MNKKGEIREERRRLRPIEEIERKGRRQDGD
jgi:hypothetical protein